MSTSRFSVHLPLCLLLFLGGEAARPAVLGQQSPRLVTGRVNEASLVTLAGNTRPETKAATDQGQVAGTLALDHMLLHLTRPVERETAFEQYIDQLHDPKSPYFHKWLTATQVGELYGPNQADVDAVTRWLESNGFVVHSVYPSGMTIDFSGTAGQVAAAFHTQIHKILFKGEEHIANMSDPQIPAALAPVVSGVVSLHDFRPHKQLHAKHQYTYPSGSVNSSSSLLVVPSDIATIYNLKPLFTAGITGSGQTIAVLEDSDLYTTSDWSTFRSKFGLSQYSSGSLSTIHPGGCADPGPDRVYGDDAEATLDAEMASTAAPNAAIQVASCPSTATTFGAQTALEGLVNSGSTPSIITFSYGECESLNGAASNAAFNSAYQQAVAEGISIFVAAGDVGAATCDNDIPSGTDIWPAANGITVNAYASSPYDVAVGGTDFSDSYFNTNSQYWSSSNSSTYGSALTYVPEIPWNDSCASTLVNQSFGGTSTTYGASGFCNTMDAANNLFLELDGGGGGPSTCATGDVTVYGGGATVKGCQGYAKPSWQTGVVGIQNDGVRDLPDVSLFSGDGLWGHYYLYCFTDFRNGGAACGSVPYDWAGAGGTSFAAPLMGGIQALINQKTGSRQGNPNYTYYALAANEYGSSGSSSCNSTNGNTVGSSCVFYDITMGDTDQPCLGNDSCFDSAVSIYEGIVSFPGVNVTSPNLPTPGAGYPGGALRGAIDPGIYGVLSTSDTSYEPAYPATTGWDFATGLGSVNAYNLANAWNTVLGRALSTHDLTPAEPVVAAASMPTRAGGAVAK